MDYGNGESDGPTDTKIELEQEEEEKKCKVLKHIIPVLPSPNLFIVIIRSVIGSIRFSSQVVSKLDERVQHMMHMMCSIRTMTEAVRQLEFDADKSPLGEDLRFLTLLPLNLEKYE